MTIHNKQSINHTDLSPYNKQNIIKRRQ